MIRIDGAYGEGGGQIVRTAVTLSAITGKPIEIRNIRANRQNSGLGNQHMYSIKAVADLFNAETENVKLGADWVRFIPKPDKFEGGTINIDIGTAGSIPLVLQTVIPAVSLSGHSVSVQITGGTDTKMSPTLDYLRFIVCEIFRNLGIRFSIEVTKRGYYPKGGGKVYSEISSCKMPNTLDLLTTRRIDPKISSVCCLLPKHVAERQISSALLRLEKNGIPCNNYSSSFEYSQSPGSSILVYSQSDFGPYIGGDAVAEKGKPAEKVGQEAADKFLKAFTDNAPIDAFLADMLVIPLCVAHGKSRYKIGKVTQHLRTNLYTASKIIDCKYQIEPYKNGNIVSITNS